MRSADPQGSARPSTDHQVTEGQTPGIAPRRRRGRPTEGVKVQVRIPDELWHTIGEEAELLEISRAELVRGILREWVANQVV